MNFCEKSLHSCEVCNYINTKILEKMLVNVNRNIVVLISRLDSATLIYNKIDKTMQHFRKIRDEFGDAYFTRDQVARIVQVMDRLEELGIGLVKYSKNIRQIRKSLKLVEEQLAKASGQEVAEEDPIAVALEYMSKVDVTLNRIAKWEAMDEMEEAMEIEG